MIVNTDGSLAALVSILLIVTKLFSIPREAAEAKAAAEQSQAASSLPPEPAQNCGQSVANLRSVLCRVHASIKTLYFVVCGGLSSRSRRKYFSLLCLFRELSHYQCLSVCS